MQAVAMHRWQQWLMACLLALGLWCSQISQVTAAAITDAQPHDKDGLVTGAQGCIGARFFPNPVFGQGTLTELTPYHAIARGTYD